MALMTGLNSAISGLDSQQTLINVTGSNLANSTTPGFKTSNVSFQALLSQTISFGSAPVGGGLGGTNPIQVGLGTQVAAIRRNFSQGEIETTGINSNLAVNGGGFFRLDSTGTGNIVFTRDGSFSLSAPVPPPASAPVGTLPQTFLVNAQGYELQGINATNPQAGNFTINTGAPPTAVNIPIGLGISKATSNVNFSGDLNGGGIVASQGTQLTSTLTAAASPTAATPLTALTGLSAPIVALDNITVTATIGGRNVTKTGTVLGGAGTNPITTVGDLMTNLIDGGLGLASGADFTGAPVNPATITLVPATPTTSTLTVTGNTGTANAITNLTITDTGTTAAPKNIAFPAFTTTQNATGESTSTDFTVYDTSGNPHIVTLTAVLQTQASAGNTWRYYIDSTENIGSGATGGDRFVTTGTIGFNPSGQPTTGTASSVTFTPGTVSSTLPSTTFNLNFSGVTDFGGTTSSISMGSQDGFGFGTLNNFSIGQDGVITGIFSNGTTKPLAQVQLATFANPNGLQATTNNDYIATSASGPQSLVLPGQNTVSGGTTQVSAAGTLVSGALEASNVDVAKEITNLIVGQRAFQADSRVIQTASTMLQELLTTIAA